MQRLWKKAHRTVYPESAEVT